MAEVYIDKNVLFEYANHKLFGERTPAYSIELVDKVKNGELEAAIHDASIFSLSNYIKFKLERPAYKHGKEMDEKDADKKSREFCKEMFQSEKWLLIQISKEELEKALSDYEFTFEDAIQFHSFQKSKSKYFITWNIKDFLKLGKNALTPRDFLQK